MGPTVAVEVAPPPASAAPELAVLLRACSQALPVGQCESRTALATPEEAGALAQVTWRDDKSVLIEVRLADLERGELTRELSFASDDEKLERWRSVGLTIATIVDELRERQEVQRAEALPGPVEAARPITEQAPHGPVSGAVPETKPTLPAPAPEHPEPKARVSAFDSLEAGGLFGTGLASGAARAGLYARGAHDVGELPVFADVSVGYALLASTDDPQVTWTEFAVGGGARITGAALRLEIGVAAVLVRASATAPDPDTGVVDTAGSWLPGGSFSGRLVWPSEKSIAFVVGARGSWLMRELVVTNAGREVARIPAYSVSGVGGVRLNF